MSPENGSRLISLSAMLTRCRSLRANPRTALPAALLSAKSQFTLEIFEADKLPASKFLATALDRVDLIGLSVVDRNYTFSVSGQVAPQRFTYKLRAVRAGMSHSLFKFWKHLFGNAD